MCCVYVYIYTHIYTYMCVYIYSVCVTVKFLWDLFISLPLVMFSFNCVQLTIWDIQPHGLSSSWIFDHPLVVIHCWTLWATVVGCNLDHRPNKVFPLQVTFVGVHCHSNRNKARTTVLGKLYTWYHDRNVRFVSCSPSLTALNQI